MINSFTKEQLLWLSENIKGILREPNDDNIVYQLGNFKTDIENKLIQLEKPENNIDYIFDRPAEFKGKWYITVFGSMSSLYLRKDLTIKKYTYTDYEDDPNNGFWETEKEAKESIKKYKKQIREKCEII